MRPNLAALALLGALALSGCHRARVADDPAADPAVQHAVGQQADAQERASEVKGIAPDDPMANGTTGDVSTSTTLPPDPSDDKPRPPRKAMIDTSVSDVSTPKTDQPQ